MFVAAFIMIITYLRGSCEKFIILAIKCKDNLFSKISTETPNRRITLEFLIVVGSNVTDREPMHRERFGFCCYFIHTLGLRNQ